MASNINPGFVATLVADNGTNSERRRLDSVIVDVMTVKMPGLSEEELWEFTEAFEEDVANTLFERETASMLEGFKLSYDVTTEDDGYYISFTETPGIKLLRDLQCADPKIFECLCCEVLDRIGGASTLTGGSGDGGIDFVAGSLRLSELLLGSTVGSEILVVGQAKRYADGHHIREKELREFVGASLVRVEELKRERSDRVGMFHPVILAFWTTSDFHSNARSFARKCGLWYLNGQALTQLAAKLDIEMIHLTERLANNPPMINRTASEE